MYYLTLTPIFFLFINRPLKQKTFRILVPVFFSHTFIGSHSWWKKQSSKRRNKWPKEVMLNFLNFSSFLRWPQFDRNYLLRNSDYLVVPMIVVHPFSAKKLCVSLNFYFRFFVNVNFFGFRLFTMLCRSHKFYVWFLISFTPFFNCDWDVECSQIFYEL